MSEWRPMETAPKNPEGEFRGPCILVYCTADGMPWPACWAEGGPDNTGCWEIFGGSKPSDQIWPEDAGGWMPLPAPPSALDRSGGLSMPKRIQRKRTKGWRMPEGAVCVDRSTKWGNPFEIGCGVVIRRSDGDTASLGKVETREQAVAWYRAYVSHYPHIAEWARDQLRGRDLACWCPLDQACHADVLLEVANGEG